MKICNKCGKSVTIGSGNYINRVPDFNTVQVRQEMRRPFPEGDFVCAGCREQDERENLHCPICDFAIKQMAGLATCTNPECPNHKGMAA